MACLTRQDQVENEEVLGRTDRGAAAGLSTRMSVLPAGVHFEEASGVARCLCGGKGVAFCVLLNAMDVTDVDL